MYSFKNLNPDVKFNAINTYCKLMNCRGLESQVDLFLNSKEGSSVMFNEEGYIMVHDVKEFV